MKNKEDLKFSAKRTRNTCYMTEMLELFDKDFKAAIVEILHWAITSVWNKFFKMKTSAKK